MCKCFDSAIELSHLHVDRGMHDRQPAGLRQLHRRHAVLQHHVRSMDWAAAICEGWESITPRAACWGASRWLTRADRRSRSWLHPPPAAEVQADRLHHLARLALAED